jgi:hypothetical protein
MQPDWRLAVRLAAIALFTYIAAMGVRTFLALPQILEQARHVPLLSGAGLPVGGP